MTILAFFLWSLLKVAVFTVMFLMGIAYTEPDAGSALGNLSMAAEPDGDGIVLTGVKSLVTAAHKADWCLTIARTRPGVPPRDGLTMFLLDMGAGGLSVRRRPTMNGWTLGEISCNGVRVACRCE